MTEPGKITQADAALALTGERTVPGIPLENYWFRRHEMIYQRIVESTARRTVLDAGPGEGYGAAMIAERAAAVLAVDYDTQAVAHIARRYPAVAVVRGNLTELPLVDGGFDQVVSLQVIEHLWDQPAFLRECLRVLRPGGRLLVSTPNRITFSPGRDTPLNPFHTRELSGAELRELVAEAGFVVADLLGVFHGPRLRELDAAHGGSIIEAQLTQALSGETWPQRLADDVASVAVDDFELLPETQAPLDESLDLVIVADKPA